MTDGSPQKPFPLSLAQNTRAPLIGASSDGSGGSKILGKGSLPIKNPSRAAKASPGSWSGVLWSRAVPIPPTLPCWWEAVTVEKLEREFEGCLGAFPEGEFGCLAGAGAGGTPINIQVWVQQLREVAEDGERGVWVPWGVTGQEVPPPAPRRKRWRWRWDGNGNEDGDTERGQGQG